MRFKHRDGTGAGRAVSLGPVRDTAAVDDDGTFSVDPEREDYDDVVDRLIEAGHEPLDDADPPDEPIEDGDGDDSDDTEDLPQASDYSEQELVDELGYRELQAIASQYDEIPGNASEEKLREELIKQRRAEVDE